MDFDNFCSFFACQSILAEEQQTKHTNSCFLSFSASLDKQLIHRGGIIVEWEIFWLEIPVSTGSYLGRSIIDGPNGRHHASSVVPAKPSWKIESVIKVFLLIRLDNGLRNIFFRNKLFCFSRYILRKLKLSESV